MLYFGRYNYKVCFDVVRQSGLYLVQLKFRLHTLICSILFHKRTAIKSSETPWDKHSNNYRKRI